MSTTDSSPIDRISPTRRPTGRAIGYQSWSELLFIHWTVPAAELQSLLPDGLTVDTFHGQAWVGLVPFHMSGVRPWWSPAIPGVSAFHETNVRTYVHRDGEAPGVWFFSLDANSSLAVRIARWKWQLPYFYAQMRLQREGRHVSYSSRRLWPGTVEARSAITADVGDLLPVAPDSGNARPGVATSGTLEHFLAERYLLYAQANDGRLLRGQVHHTPYPLCTAHISSLDETLIAAAGITTEGPPAHVAYSAGVDVEIFPLRPI